MSDVIIQGKTFRWARERAGYSDEKLAIKMHLRPEKIRAWEAGTDYPNFKQAQKLASELRIPLGYLVLSQPPLIATPITDFRTLPGQSASAISPDLQDVLDDALRKRDWYAEWRQEENLPSFDFVGKFNLQSNREEIIRDMRLVLEIPLDFGAHMTSWDEHLRALVQKVESAGILVLQNGVVGNNTHRKLSLEEFRGFTLADPFAPLIFINAQDSIAARIFTLAHELTHIWTGTSGISNPEISPVGKEALQLERICNQVAAELLVPEDDFSGRWNHHLEIFENVQQLACHYRVSAQVILRRSYDLGLISTHEYQVAFQEVLDASKPISKGSGGDFYKTVFSRNSKRFTRTLISALASQQIYYLDASRLLNIKPDKMDKVIEQLG